MNLIGSQLHYHCRFDVIPKQGEPRFRSRLLHDVRRWLIGAIKRHADVNGVPPSVQGRWFFVGGQWQLPGHARVSVETAAMTTEPATSEAEESGPWAMRFEHPCRDERFRQWGVDIAIWPTSVAPGAMGFALTTTHWMLPGYIGKEPLLPTPTAPGIVKALLKANGWEIRAGAVRLSDAPTRIHVGDGKELASLLTSPSRECPIVYASADPASGQPLIDCDELASVLSGVALVCAAQAGELDDELPWLLPSDFCCRRGTVRVYQPHLDVNSEWDVRRHRYFSPQQIAELGHGEVMSMIVRGVARRFHRWDDAAPTSVDDVRRLAAHQRLAELREESGGVPTKEWVQFLEDMNLQLEADAKGLRDTVSRLEGQVQESDLERQELDERLRQVERQRDDANRRVQDAHGRVRASESQLEAINSFATWPRSVAEVVERIAVLHSTRVLFTQEATRSAEDARLEDLAEAWRCLWSVATLLHDLYLRDGLPPSRVVEEFRSRTGFDIALTESKQTQNDKKLMALRRVTVDGENFDVTAHVGFGNRDPDMLRVHYAVDRERGRLVIGHCGGHLTTAGTRRRGT